MGETRRKKAVALKYRREEMPAPEVVAKGAGKAADNILELARDNEVPVVEDQGLARVLYSLEKGDMIPEVLYQPVAKILSIVILYKQKEG